MENKLLYENLNNFTNKILNNQDYNAEEIICLTNSFENYKLDKLIQEPKVIKYKFKIDEYNFIISFSDSRVDIKYNLEIIFPNEPDFVYSIPFVEEKFFQYDLEQLYRKISMKFKLKKEDDLIELLTRFPEI